MGAMSLAEKSWEKDQVSGESSEASRRESTVSRSLSEWNWSDSRSEEKVSPSTSSVSSIFKVSWIFYNRIYFFNTKGYRNLNE